MKILEEKKNNLLKRNELRFIISSETNPGFEGSKKILIEKLKVPEDNVIIKKIKNNFGTKQFLIQAFVYNSKSDKEKIEPKPKEKKNQEAKKE